MRAVPVAFTAILIVAGLGIGVAHAFTIDKGGLTKPDGSARFTDPDDQTSDRLSGDPSASSSTSGKTGLRLVPNSRSSFYTQQDAAREQELFPSGNGALLPPGRR